jgi:FG-GAP-like repeat
MRLTRLFSLLALTFAASAVFAQDFVQNHYATGNAPFAAASADFNRDGHPDLLVSNNSGNAYLTVMLGTSSGTFDLSSNVPAASNPVRIAVGDFNGDGYPDAAVLEQNTFQIFLSAHNGAMLPQTPQAIPATGVDMVAVDLNGNHVPDLAITRCSTHCSLELWRNDGTGKFTQTQAMSLDHTFRDGLVAADFDRDGHDDLAVTTPTSVLILHSNNNGTVSLRQTIAPTGTDLFALAAGDIDAKNGADLVFAANQACNPTDCLQPPTVYVYLNDGTGHLSQKQTLTPNSNGTITLRLVDISGDNRLDLIAENQELQMNHGSLNWAHYAGGGTFASFATLIQLGEPRDLVARDFNLDGRHDFAIPDNGFGDFGIDTGTYIFFNERNDNGAFCSMPSSANLSAKICQAGSFGANDTFTFLGVGNSPTGVRRMELWVDGKKLYNSPDDRLRASATLSPGKHTVMFVAVDQFGQTAKTTTSVTAP